MDTLVFVAVLVVVAVAFTVSASAGFGGSLLLVPALALVLGTKSGIALAALLLAGNNVVKLWAYRHTVPWRPAAGVVVIVLVTTAIGARLLVAAPERLVTIAVIASFGATLLVERLDLTRLRRAGAIVLAAGAGLTSGFSGTSGPLKGLAVRSLELDRAHVVGALSLISLVGDVTKTAVFAEAQLITNEGYALAVMAVPLMIGATLAGRRINQGIGEVGYTALFWTVMVGYTTRLVMGL